MYLAFIKPDTNYMYKSEPARVFANYVEFGDDIGSGQSFRLDNYYRLCDEIVEELEADEEIQAMLDAELSRRADKEGMNADELKRMPGRLRIVVYDMMYCADRCGLYVGIAKPAKKGSKEEKDRIRQKRIDEIHNEMDEKDAELNEVMNDLPDYPDLVGVELTNIKYGKGTVARQNGKYLYIYYDSDEKVFALPDCISKGYLKGADEQTITTCKTISEIIDKQRKLTSSLKGLGMELSMIE